MKLKWGFQFWWRWSKQLHSLSPSECDQKSLPECMDWMLDDNSKYMGAADLGKKNRTQSRRNQWKVSLFCSFSTHIFLSLHQHKSQNSVAGMDKKNSERIVLFCFFVLVLESGTSNRRTECGEIHGLFSFFLSFTFSKPHSWSCNREIDTWREENPPL